MSAIAAYAFHVAFHGGRSRFDLWAFGSRWCGRLRG
jgi:hypothetical protein